MADWATHYFDNGSWETDWHTTEDKARAEARRLVKEGTAKEVFVSVEVARAYSDDVVFEEID